MNSVIIVAAGSGKRMNMDINKQFIKLNKKEIIAHTIDVFYKNKNVDEIIVCIKKEEEELFKDKIIISDEISSGIVPLKKEDRMWREETGRCLQYLSKESSCVYRVFCGISTIIKS